MHMESNGADVSAPVVVIMAGGAGTRFWPASTRLRPKQFLSLLGEDSLLQESYARARHLTGPDRIMVFTNADFADLVGDQLPELQPRNIVAEPARRDTAAAVCLAALLVRQRFGDAVTVILTADHLIEPVEEFVRVVTSACRAAAGDAVLYTIGVLPDHAATAYGYLEAGGSLLDDGGVIHRKVRSFREKPDKEIAKRYLAVGDYLWNSGMFIWRTGVVLDAFAEHLPGHLAVLVPAVEAAAEGGFNEADQEAALAEAFPRLPSVSVDYGIMEKARNVRLVEATFTWNDLGSWPALSEFLPRDDAENGHRGRIAVHDGAANVVFCEDEDELVALVGVSDLVVVRAGKRTLVVARERVEEIKDLVRLLERDGREEDL
jgi:mannose-1-phosphate guanylyltransferase